MYPPGKKDYTAQAVEYFTEKLASYGEGTEVPIRSLLGHRSQASPEVRHVSGQHFHEFREFLLKHPDHFVIDDENETVILKDFAEVKSHTQELHFNESVDIDPEVTQTLLDFFAQCIEVKGPILVEQLFQIVSCNFPEDTWSNLFNTPSHLTSFLRLFSDSFHIQSNLVTLLQHPKISQKHIKDFNKSQLVTLNIENRMGIEVKGRYDDKDFDQRSEIKAEREMNLLNEREFTNYGFKEVGREIKGEKEIAGEKEIKNKERRNDRDVKNERDAKNEKEIRVDGEIKTDSDVRNDRGIKIDKEIKIDGEVKNEIEIRKERELRNEREIKTERELRNEKELRNERDLKNHERDFKDLKNQNDKELKKSISPIKPKDLGQRIASPTNIVEIEKQKGVMFKLGKCKSPETDEAPPERQSPRSIGQNQSLKQRLNTIVLKTLQENTGQNRQGMMHNTDSWKSRILQNTKVICNNKESKRIIDYIMGKSKSLSEEEDAIWPFTVDKVVVGVDFEGINLGVNGSITLVQIATLDGFCYVFDLIVCPSMMADVVKILESPKIIKVSKLKESI